MENPAFKSLLLAAVLFGVWNSGWANPIDFGKMAYRTSCADCHGIDGKGDGPKAAELKKKPSDLTVEAKNNNGVFPVQSIYEIIDGRKPIPASGPRQMPIWGQAFLSFGPDSQRIPENRIMAIIDYLKRIQAE
jgi:mono/diheme cytochrome c family protein